MYDRDNIRKFLGVGGAISEKERKEFQDFNERCHSREAYYPLVCTREALWAWKNMIASKDTNSKHENSHTNIDDIPLCQCDPQLPCIKPYHYKNEDEIEIN